MTARAAIRRLRSLGFELTLLAPDRIGFRFAGEGEPPPEARPLLQELRENKAEALTALEKHTPGRWDDAWERARLEAVLSWCDQAAPARGVGWSDCMAFVRVSRPELLESLNAALASIDAAHIGRDLRRHIAALAELQRAVLAIVEARCEVEAAGS